MAILNLHVGISRAFLPMSIRCIFFTGFLMHGLCFFLLFCASNINAQFDEVASSVGVIYENVGFLPSGFSAADFNDDGWDDLTIGTNNNGIYFYQNNGGTFELIEPLPYISGMIRAVQWLDVDGDEDLDFFANRYNSFPVMYRNDGSGIFTDLSYMLPLVSYETGTSTVSWGDYNRDGLLDAYFCNYYIMGNITNWLLRNDGDFNFTDVTVEAGAGDSIKTSYQAMWIDYDLNGWIDLYVSNDRMDGNAMYRNLGDGTFELVDNATGLNVVLDGMGINFDDYDNDMDYDLYIANTENGSLLLNQNNGVFSDVAQLLGVSCPDVVSWGVQWTDAQNDGLIDLYVVNDTPWINSNQNYFFYQTTNGVFQQDIYDDFATDDYESYSCGEFDLNADGYMDIVNINQYPPDVQIWKQQTGNNNWIRFELSSDGGNTHGVGANIMVFFGEEKRLRSTFLGESFLAQNPYHETFGIGAAVEVDSVAVLWPSGNIQMYYDLNINEVNTLIEEPSANAYDLTHFTICENDSVVLYPGPYAQYTWNNGLQQPSIFVSEPGIYEVNVVTVFGWNETIQYMIEEGLEQMPLVSLIQPLCHGDATGAVEIEMVDGLDQVIWLDGYNGFVRDDLIAGIYPYFLSDIHNCTYYGLAEITEPQAISISLMADTVCPGGLTEIQIELSGGSGALTMDWGNTNPLSAETGEHFIVISDENGCGTVDSVIVAEYEMFNVNISSPIACYGATVELVYSAEGASSSFEFDFDEVDPLAVFPGEYFALVTDENLCYQIVPFAVIENPPLFAELFFDQNAQSILATVSGGTPPYSIQWPDGSEGHEMMNPAPGSYVCNISDEVGCSAEAEITIEVGINESMLDLISVYPVPSENFVFVETVYPTEIMILNSAGGLVHKTKCNSKMMFDMSALPIGVYCVVAGNKVLRFMKV